MKRAATQKNRAAVLRIPHNLDTTSALVAA
jgi:hypothetical protein